MLTHNLKVQKNQDVSSTAALGYFSSWPENLALQESRCTPYPERPSSWWGQPNFPQTAGLFLGWNSEVLLGWSLWSVHTSRFDLIHDSSNEHFGRVSSSKTRTSTYSTSTNFEKQRIHLRMKVGSQHHNNHGVVGSQHHNIHLRICEIWTCFFSSRWINYVIHDGPYSDPNLRT